MKTDEHNLQVAIINILRLNRVFCFAVPNGGKRCITTAVYLKKEGALSGVADLILLLPSRCVFVELKTKKGVQSESQKIFEKEVKDLGFEYYVWRSVDDVLDFLKGVKNVRCNE